MAKGKRKTPDAPPPFQEVVLALFRHFCEENHSDFADFVERYGLAEGCQDSEALLSTLATVMEAGGFDANAFLAFAAKHLDELGENHVTVTHMSVFETLWGTRMALKMESGENPEQIAFAFARLVPDRLRPGLYTRIQTAPNTTVAMRRGLSLAHSCIGDCATIEKTLISAIRSLQPGEEFLHQTYERLLDGLREEQQWRENVAHALSAYLHPDKIKLIRTTNMIFPEDLPDPPSQAFLLYRTLVLYWLPPPSERSIAFLKELGIANPEPERPLTAAFLA